MPQQHTKWSAHFRKRETQPCRPRQRNVPTFAEAARGSLGTDIQHALRPDSNRGRRSISRRRWPPPRLKAYYRFLNHLLWDGPSAAARPPRCQEEFPWRAPPPKKKTKNYGTDASSSSFSSSSDNLLPRGTSTAVAATREAWPTLAVMCRLGTRHFRTGCSEKMSTVREKPPVGKWCKWVLLVDFLWMPLCGDSAVCQ